MEQLHELEKRVLDIIQKNKELRELNSKLESEVVSLREQSKRMETSLMSQDNCNKSLKTEKASIKTSIEELLQTIKALEKSS
jgi:hypothetical protein